MKITKEDAETILAFHDGKSIQFSSDTSDGWKDVQIPSWSFNYNQYRVKPEPKEIWVNEYDNLHERFNYYSKHKAIANARIDATRVAVHYKEVIEE